MTPRTLRDLVHLWQEVYSCDVKPSVFISQKLEQYQLDKIETDRSATRPNLLSNNIMHDDETQNGSWIVYSTEMYEKNNNGSRRHPMWSVTTYKRIAPDCCVDFQLKPPIKSMFTGISGPYK